MMTPIQRRLYDYIASRDLCPTYEEMQEAMSLKSRSGAHRIVLQLEARGIVRRLPGRSRAIEIVRRDRPEYFIWDDKEKALVRMGQRT